MASFLIFPSFLSIRLHDENQRNVRTTYDPLTSWLTVYTVHRQRAIQSPLGAQCTLYSVQRHTVWSIYSPFCVQFTQATCDPLTILRTVYTGNVRSTHLFVYSVHGQRAIHSPFCVQYTKAKCAYINQPLFLHKTNSFIQPQLVDVYTSLYSVIFEILWCWILLI